VVWLVTITAGEEGVEELQEDVLEEESSIIEEAVAGWGWW